MTDDDQLSPEEEAEIERSLRAMDEDEHRVERGDADEAYRYRHRGSNGIGDHIDVLIERRGEPTVLIAEGFVPQRRVLKPLTTAEWQRVRQAIEGARLFDMPEHDGRHGFDGWSWEIEGRRDGRYRALSRWCPEPGKPFPGCVSGRDRSDQWPFPTVFVTRVRL